MKLRYTAALILALVLSVPAAIVPLQAQTVSPTSIGPVCTGFPVSITLPPAAVTDQVDVFFLFDDTSSFEDVAPSVIGIFGGLVNSLETALPGVSFGFGVGRFEDYGGPGAGFAVPQASVGRPFILNQPIVTTETAGGAAPRDALINTALARTAPGLGGDPPEAAMEGLNQVATGAGFDGDDNGSTLDSGVAGASTTQTTPGTSGDVPAFSSGTLPASGTLGGVGWRPRALHLVIVVADICPVAAFPFGSPIPAFITGADASSEPAAAFACPASKLGVNRFGFVSDSKTVEGNTIVDANNNRTAVAPRGAATVQGTVSALNGLGIRVIGMGPGVAPTPFLGPTFDPSTWLSAMARVTRAVDGFGSPLVFDTDVSLDDLSAAILSGITTTTTLPVDISLSTSSLPSGLTFSFSPQVVRGVSPGGGAPFDVALDAGGSAVSGTFDLNFLDVSSAQVLGTIPVTVSCLADDNSRAEVSIVKTTNGTDNDTAPGPSVLLGSTVTWTYSVTNTGTAPLTNLAVTDDKVGLICTIAALDAGATRSCTKTGTAVAGAYENTGTVAGTSPVGSTVTASNVDHYFGARPAISIVKTTNGTNNDTAPGPSLLAGSAVTWTYLVTNTGNVALTNVTVTDDKFGAICTIATLDAGASGTCTKSGVVVVGAYENKGIATGTPLVGPAVTASNVDHYFGARPGIAIVKTTNGTNNDAAPGPSILGGSTVTWTYLVTNTGNVALTNVSVNDDKVGAICDIGTLAAGASRSCTASRIAVAGPYKNVGTATGTPPVGPAVTASDSEHYFGVDSGTFFVVGDVERHRIGDDVNFWGAQWWMNNQMSVLVTPGVASFKGYTREVVRTGNCGGTWATRPGNSPPPPDVIPLYVPIIVTDTVAKSGPDIRGTIREILVVLQDGGYSSNPGHRGNGRVISSVCK